MNGNWETYLIALSGCLVLSGALSLALRFLPVGKPNKSDSDRDWLRTARASTTVLIAFICMVPLSALITPISGGAKQLDIVLITAVVIFLAGSIYEYHSLPYSWCIGIDLAAGLIIWTVGNGIEMQDQLPESVAFTMTLIWFLLIQGGMRIIDKGDGIALGTGSLICLTLFVLAMANGQVLLATLAISLASSSVGFLVIYPDSGKMRIGAGSASTIGFLVAFFALMLYSSGNFVVSALIPLFSCSFVLLSVAIKGAVNIVNRAGNTQLNVTCISDQLLMRGFPSSSIYLGIYMSIGIIGALTVLMYVADASVGIWLAGLTAFLHIVGGSVAIWRTLDHQLPRISSDR